MNRLYQIAAVFALWMAIPAYAVRNYSCDFESEASRSRWVMNRTANATVDKNLKNRWYIGEPGTNGKGTKYGLYVSDNQGQTAHYSNNSCWVIAYDTIALDHLSTANDYTLSFDYCAMGNSDFDGIYVMWIPMTDTKGDSIKVMSNSTSSGYVPYEYENYVLVLQPKAYMYNVNGTQTWRQCVVNIPNSQCDGKPHYLAFAWANTSLPPMQPGGMVDNIMITDTRLCDEATNLQLTIQGTTSLLSWKGTATEYEVTAYSYETNEWYGPKLVTGTSTMFSNLPIGQTDFIVRPKCAEDLFGLKTSISELVYYPDQMCIDYLSLDDSNCFVAQSKVSGTTWEKTMKWTNQYVDHGQLSDESRHTKHFSKDELDPRTATFDGRSLRAVPDGEIASVRLGNWKVNAEAERIEFKLHVDAISSPILMLKYAVILEKPNDSCKPNPGFLLRVLDKNKQLISDCASADFDYRAAAASSDTTWHKSPSRNDPFWGNPVNSNDVMWKDWTPVGINLTEYNGQDLYVQLTSYDCGGGGHYGYSYFTLGCSDGQLKGMKCGAINPVFEAPDGFVYRWMYASSEKYREPDGHMPEKYVLGHNQTYVAGMLDDSLYVVDCMFAQDSSCYFSLYASTLATNPVSVMKEPEIQRNCQQGKYTVKFDASDSWVQEIDHVTKDTLVSRIHKIDSYEWNVEGISHGWSDEVSPTFEFPEKGGNFLVSLRTISGMCDSTIYYVLQLDSLGPTRDTVTVTLCDEMRQFGFIWNEKKDTVYYDYGMDSVVLLNPYTTCDSIIYLELTAPHRVFVDTIVLPEMLPFDFHGRSYTKTIVDTVPISPTNCDTTWILDFEVYESLLANMPVTDYVLCEDDKVLTLIYDITRGRGLSYEYSFDDNALPSEHKKEEQRIGHYEIVIPLSPMPTPNVYNGELILEDSIPKWNVHIPFSLTIQYASSVIAQRWNDVLAIRNAEYNGGYQFDSVQWYMNGKPIEGATDFNYYVGPDAKLRFGEEYRALLWRNDGVILFTCPVFPEAVPADVADMPSLINTGAPLAIKGKGTAYWFDMLGRPYGAQPYDMSEITAPASQGYYLLVLQSEDTRTVHPILVR